MQSFGENLFLYFLGEYNRGKLFVYDFIIVWREVLYVLIGDNLF